MRFLADECVEAPVVQALRAAGHDVLWVAEGQRGLADAEVLAAAVQQARILMTNDKDFGEAAYRQRQVALGIVLLRFGTAVASDKAARLIQMLPMLEAHLPGHFAVVTEKRVRLRPLVPDEK